MFGGSRREITNTLHNLIKQNDNYSVIDKNMLRIQIKQNINTLIKNREDTSLKRLEDLKALIKY